MRPRFTMHDGPNCCRVDREQSSNSPLGLSFIQVLPYCRNVLLDQISVLLFLAGVRVVSSLSNAIESVSQVCTFKKVKRIAAFSVVATMAKFNRRRHLSEGKHVCSPMGNQGGPSNPSNTSVTLGRTSPSPGPALIQTTYFNVLPESFVKRYFSILRAFRHKFLNRILMFCHSGIMVIGIGKERQI